MAAPSAPWKRDTRSARIVRGVIDALEGRAEHEQVIVAVVLEELCNSVAPVKYVSSLPGGGIDRSCCTPFERQKELGVDGPAA